MSTILTFAGLWLIASFILGLVIGRWMERCSREPRLTELILTDRDREVWGEVVAFPPHGHANPHAGERVRRGGSETAALNTLSFHDREL